MSVWHVECVCYISVRMLAIQRRTFALRRVELTYKRFTAGKMLGPRPETFAANGIIITLAMAEMPRSVVLCCHTMAATDNPYIVASTSTYIVALTEFELEIVGVLSVGLHRTHTIHKNLGLGRFKVTTLRQSNWNISSHTNVMMIFHSSYEVLRSCAIMSLNNGNRPPHIFQKLNGCMCVIVPKINWHELFNGTETQILLCILTTSETGV